MDSQQERRRTARLIFTLQNNFWYSIFITALALISGATLAYEFLGENVSEDTILLMHKIDFIIAWIFLIDFSIGVYFAPKKLHYMRHNWLDLISSIPSPNSFFHALRIVRITRLARVTNAGLNIKSGVKKTRSNNHRRKSNVSAKQQKQDK